MRKKESWTTSSNKPSVTCVAAERVTHAEYDRLIT
jgi:hypothetical protein